MALRIEKNTDLLSGDGWEAHQGYSRSAGAVRAGNDQHPALHHCLRRGPFCNWIWIFWHGMFRADVCWGALMVRWRKNWRHVKSLNLIS